MKELDKKELEQLFYCDPSSPSGLRWKQDRMSGIRMKIYSARKGDIAGYKNNGGYYVVTYNLCEVLCHRIVYTLNYGDPAEGIIDHVDGRKDNNCISNLRKTTQKINTHNTSIRHDNKTGVKGVHFRMRVLPGGTSFSSWVASWMKNGKPRSSEYSIKKYGDEVAFQMAVEKRNQMIEELNECGEMYTTRHTTSTNNQKEESDG